MNALILTSLDRPFLVMLTRFILVCVGVTLPALAFAEGDYQHTKDGRTIVWNSTPRPGDVSTWFGGRDSEGYANGAGTLTWYTAEGNIYGRYFGNMVRGKFNGQINLHLKGKTAHALFVDGQRSSRWNPGPASSRTTGEENVRLTKGAEAARATAPLKEIQTSQPKPAQPAQEIAKTKPAPPEQPAIAQPPVEPARPQIAKANPMEKPDIPAEGPQIAKAEAVKPIPSAPPVKKAIKPDVPAEGPRIAKAEAVKPSSSPKPTKKSVAKADIPAEGPEKTQPAKSSKPTAPTAKTAAKQEKKGAEFDESLQRLVGPPQSLEPTPIPGARSENIKQEAPANAQLTSDEVVDLADTEARAQGYDLSEYQRPKADYSTVKDKWSLFYDQKKSGEMPQAGKHFIVTVDDKSRQTSLEAPQ
jgi:hypothetical protein